MILWMLLACSSKAPVPVLEAPAVEDPVVAEPVVVAPTIARCGGIAGLRCPEGTRCEDDPTDSCDPGTGADCMGLCQPGAPGRRQLGNPQSCPKIKFACMEGERSYFDATGCGCEPNEGPAPL